MKKNLPYILIIIIVVSLISALLFTVKPEDLVRRIPGLEGIYSTSLTITTQKGVADVVINGENSGRTPLELTKLPAGTYEIEMQRISDDGENFYKPFKVSIDLLEETEAVVKIEIGPNNINHGYIIYYSEAPKADQNKGYLSVTSDAPNASVVINNKTYDGNTSLIELTEGEYEVKVRSEGYEDIDIPIVIRNDLNLILKVNQMQIPIILEEVSDEN